MSGAVLGKQLEAIAVRVSRLNADLGLHLKHIAAEVLKYDEKVEVLEKRIAKFQEYPFVPLQLGLTKYETKLLACLMTREVAHRDAIMLYLYGDNVKFYPEPKIIDIFIHKIRAKIKPYGFDIETLWGRGYRLTEQAKETIQKLIEEKELAHA